MKTIIKEYGKKLLSLVMAVVMTLTLVNLAPFAQEAKAASFDVYILFDNGVTSSANPKLHAYGNGYDLGWIEPSTFSKVDSASTASGTWYKATLSPSYSTLNNCPVNVIINAGGDNDGKWVTLTGDGPSYYIRRTTDASYQMDEATANNTYGLSGSVAKPDMVVTNVWWEPASPTAGDKVTFHATIKNQGEAATPGDQTNGVAFWIDGNKLNLWSGGSYGAIQPGQSVDVQADGGEVTWTATQGSHSIRAMVDDENRYTESNDNNNTWEGTINVAAATPTTTTITFVSQNSGIQESDARIYVIEGTINSGDFKDGNNVMTKGTAMTETTDGTWTATISSSTTVVTFVRVSRSSDGNYYWGWQWENTQRGTETVYTATANGAGYWGQASEEPTTSAPTTFTFTFKDGTSDGWLDDANALFKIYADNVEYTVSGGSGTWTATLPSNVSTIKVNRLNPDYPNTSPWNSWTIDATTRGSETTYTATGSGNWDSAAGTGSGTGQWGTPTEQPTVAPSGDIYGTPLTDTQIKDLSHLELEDVVDANNGAQDLFVVPAVIYNYKPSGGGYWDQFINLDRAIMNTYYGSDKMRYPLILGAPNSWWDVNDRPLGNLVPGFNDSLTQMQALWFVNHNLEWYGHTGGAGTGISSNAPVQGLVAGFLSEDGQLLSAENNVIMPLFDDNFLGTTGEGNVVDGTWAVKYGNSDNPLSFPFRIDGDYYVFDSSSGTDNIKVVDDKITYNSSASAQVMNLHDGKIGFFPFDNGGDSGENGLTFGYGARFDIPFNVVNGDPSKATPTVVTKEASIGWNNDSVQTWTVDLGTTLTAGQTYTIVLDSDMGGGITWDNMVIDGQTKYFGDKSWYTTKGDIGYLYVNDINGSYDCLSKIDGKIIMSITPTTNISNFTLHGKTYNNNYNLGVNVYATTPDKIVYPPEDIVFNFSGDDDLWVFVDGKLVLDIGGAHTKASGSINFTDGTVTVNNAYAMNYGTNSVNKTGVTTTNVDWIKFDDPKTTHTMTVFYLERGLGDSNLKISFNFTPLRLTQRNGLTVSNTVDFSDVNNGFLTDLDSYDFNFVYDIYDVTDYTLSGNKNLLFENGTTVINGDGGRTAYLEQEHTDGTGTIRGDEVKLTQSQYPNFDTSYELINTSGNVINSSANGGNPYNVVDGKLTDGETSDIYFELEDGSGAESNLHINAAFTNKAKATSITFSKLDNSIAHVDSDQYTFVVEYTKLLGVAKTGFFSGEYTITDTRNNSTRTAATSNGEITIYAYEVVTINGVPVDSEIRISEKNDGNYIKTVVTTSASVETEVDNDDYYAISSDANVTYDWEIENGDKNTATFFAEAGTAVIINCGDELANIQLSSTTKTGEFRYQVEVPADTITVNAPSSSPVTGGADLVVTDISWGGQDIAVGDEVVFTVTVKNVGDADVPANEVIGLDITVDGNGDNTLWCDTYANGLKAGATVTLTINGGKSSSVWTATDGTHTFRANIDDRGTVEEVNESNNYYEISLKTPYEAGGIEQRVASTTYSYHEEIIAGKVSGTIGTVTHTKDSITYTYPGNSATGEDVFYYEVAQIADSDVVVNDQTIVRAGEIFYETRTAARVYSYKLNDDVYVLDYGLPVILSADPNNLKANDITSLSGVAANIVDMGYAVNGLNLVAAKPATGVYAKSDAYANEGNGSFGKATLNGSEYKYSLNKLFDGIETFYYGVQVTAAGATGTLNATNATPIMTSKVTVVPASIVYYEDNFSYDSTSGTTSAITYTGTGVVVNNTGLDITQSNSLDDLYGFDEAYDNMIGDGNGSTMLEKSQKVEFTFKGTGFDIVARTAETATVIYVVSKDNKLVEMGNVDTYYDAGVLYQLPVISVQDLEYGEYKVQFMILTSSSYSEFYFDGIRIYNPLGAGSGYYNSYENGATVTPIIDMILGDCTFTETGIYDANGNLIESTNTVPDGSQISVVGNMITEDLGSGSIKNGSSLADLLSDGPNNEVYLGSGSKLVFYATPNNEVANDADRTLQVEVKAISNKMEMTDVVVDNKSAWVATASKGTPSNAIDDNLSTRWNTSYQSSETEREWFQVDMAKEYTFDAINLALGSSTNDWPANYEVFVSNDGTEWTSVKTGAGAAGLETIYLGPTSARFVRIEQWGIRSGNYWSVHEFSLKSVVRNTDPSSYTNKYKWSVIDANCDTNNTSRLIDNKTVDRWTSYAMTDRQTEDTAAYFVVDLGVNYDFDTVQMFLGTSTNDQPDNYKISVSNDNATWTVVASGAAAGGTEEYSVGAQNARYVKVEGWGGGNYWSVHEFGIANKSAAAVDTGLDLSLNNTKDVIANIDTNTAMYYEIPMSLCSQQPDGSYLVVINGASADDNNLSFTNLKVKGYDIKAFETATTVNGVYITDITVNGSSDIRFNRKSEVEFVLTLSENADMNKDNLSLTANGINVNIRNVEAVQGTSNQYIVKTLAPNVVGTFTYEFVYKNADGKLAKTSVAASITATSSGDRPAVPSRPR